MGTKRYVLTTVSCSCDAASVYFDLTDEERALLDRIDAKFRQGNGGGIDVDDPDELARVDMGEYRIRDAEYLERRLAIEQ